MFFLEEDSAIDAYVEPEASDIEDAVQDIFSDEGSDIDSIAEITDEDVEEFDYDPENDDNYYDDNDLSLVPEIDDSDEDEDDDYSDDIEYRYEYPDEDEDIEDLNATIYSGEDY